MAYGILPKPGTEYGPCVEECTHVDCAESRRMAETVCAFCQKPIGYDTKMILDDGDLVHYFCLLEKYER